MISTANLQPAPTAARHIRVEALGNDDLERVVAHQKRHHPESGKDGEPVFMPVLGRTEEESRLALQTMMAKSSLDEVGWYRAWGAIDSNNRVVGMVNLKGDSVESGRHLALLGLGLERSYRRMGLGRKLLETALAWARQQPQLIWVHLSVFSHNQAARKLYKSCGFEELGVIPDRFRFPTPAGVQLVDDVLMRAAVGKG